MNAEQLQRWRAGCARVLGDILSHPGPEGRKYITESGRLPHRYSFGTASASRQLLHDPVWASMVDLPTITPIITKVYGAYFRAIAKSTQKALAEANSVADEALGNMATVRAFAERTHLK